MGQALPAVGACRTRHERARTLRARRIRRGGAALALVAVFASASGSGCASGEDGVAPTVAVTTVVTDTVGQTVTVSETVTEAAAPPAAPSRDRPHRAGELRFRGNGDRRLPPIRVAPRRGTTLRWTNRGEVFSLFSEEGTLVDSVGTRGATFLQRGVHRIDVVASGTWVIRIPRARRAR